MSQIDTFDPKKRGNSKSKPRISGTDYALIDARARMRLLKQDREFASSMKELWRGRDYSLFQKTR